MKTEDYASSKLEVIASMSFKDSKEAFIAYFDGVEFKKITQTDKNKGAIVPLRQCESY